MAGLVAALALPGVALGAGPAIDLPGWRTRMMDDAPPETQQMMSTPEMERMMRSPGMARMKNEPGMQRMMGSESAPRP
jgi:hypothetical protein